MSTVHQCKCDGCGKREDIPSDAYSMHSISRPDGWIQTSMIVYPEGFFGQQRLADYCSYDCVEKYVLAIAREKLTAA